MFSLDYQRAEGNILCVEGTLVPFIYKDILSVSRLDRFWSVHFLQKKKTNRMFSKSMTMKLLPYTKRFRGFKDCMYILAFDWPFVKVWVQSLSAVLHSQAGSKSSQGPGRQLPKRNTDFLILFSLFELQENAPPKTPCTLTLMIITHGWGRIKSGPEWLHELGGFVRIQLMLWIWRGLLDQTTLSLGRLTPTSLSFTCPGSRCWVS